MKKKEIREKAERLRNSIEKQEKEMLDHLIEDRLLSWFVFQKARSIFCYVSFRGEISTLNLLKGAFEMGKSVSVPKIDRKTGEMKAYLISRIDEDLEPGEYTIMEPKPSCKEMDYSRLELIIAPGLAFTMRGDRLGYGGGFYDRFLLKYRHPRVCGLTYDRLIRTELPVTEKDMPVDYLVTESGIIITEKGKERIFTH